MKNTKLIMQRWGKPHITLVNFVQYEMMEERIVNRLQSAGDGCILLSK